MKLNLKQRVEVLAAENADLRAQVSELKAQLAAQRSQLAGATAEAEHTARRAHAGCSQPAERSEEFDDRSSALAKLKLLCMSGQRAVLRGNKLVLL